MGFLRRLAALSLLLIAAGIGAAAEPPRIARARALFCASLAGPLEPVEIEAPEDFAMELVTPRFLIGERGKGIVLSRGDDFEKLGSIPLRDEGGGVAHIPLGFSEILDGGRRIPGLGTETKFARLKQAFEVLGYDEVTATISDDNAASLALHRKLGFRPAEGYPGSYVLTRRGYDELLRDLEGTSLEDFVRPRNQTRPIKRLIWVKFDFDDFDAFIQSAYAKLSARAELRPFYDALRENRPVQGPVDDYLASIAGQLASAPRGQKAALLRPAATAIALERLCGIVPRGILAEDPAELLERLEASALQATSPPSLSHPVYQIMTEAMGALRSNADEATEWVRDEPGTGRRL